MKKYDFRFDTKLVKTFVGKAFKKYKHAEFLYTNSVTGIVGFEINGVVYKLTDEYEAVDFLALDDEATLFQISESNWNDIDSRINTNINEFNVDEIINKVILVNDHTVINIENKTAYDMLDTKAIIFCFDNHEVCFAKQDCWFSQEIEVYKGYNLIEKIGDGKGILEDFESDELKNAFVERTFVQIN